MQERLDGDRRKLKLKSADAGGHELENVELAEDFRRFHKERAQLRITLIEEHKKFTKEEQRKRAGC